MTIQEIIRALRRLQVETGSLACLGCAHENSCSTKGCAILRQAAEVLEQQSVEVEGMRSAANSLKMHLEKATAERDAAEKDRAALADFELALCEEFCFGDMRSDIPPCEWYADGTCKLRKWRDKYAEAD